MFIDTERRMLYLGSKNIFYIFDLDNALSDVDYVRNYTWPAADNVIDSCLMKGTQFTECQNYIQTLLFNDVDKRLLVCGTNAQAPRCRYFKVSISFCTIMLYPLYISSRYIVHWLITNEIELSSINVLENVWIWIWFRHSYLSDLRQVIHGTYLISGGGGCTSHTPERDFTW